MATRSAARSARGGRFSPMMQAEFLSLSLAGGNAEAAAPLVGLIAAQACRPRPDERVLSRMAELLSASLDQLRVAQNGADPDAGPAIEAVRLAVAESVAEAPADPSLVMLLVRAFGQARVEPGPALRATVMQALDAAAAEEADRSAGFDDLAEQMAAAADHDPFALFAELSASAAATPPAQRAAIGAEVARAAVPAARLAALGFVLDADINVAGAALEALAQAPASAPTPSLLVERLILIRPWLPASHQGPLDAAVRALRPRAAPPVPASSPSVLRCLATPCDGSGAQSLFALLRDGRRYACAAILLKEADGIDDAWVQTGLSRREADSMIQQIESVAGAVSVGRALLRRRLGDALAANLARAQPPPFGLLQAVEALALAPLVPEQQPAAAVAERLLADSRARGRPATAKEPHFETIDSWFEIGEAVEAALAGLVGRAERIEAVLRQVLPARRGYWARLCAWTADALKEAGGPPTAAWHALALAARALAGEGALDADPVARMIATATVDAFAQR